MALVKELKKQEIVVVASNFNPSIFNQYWLIKNKFIAEKEIFNPIFTSEISLFSTKDFKLMVNYNQLQFCQTNLEIDFFIIVKNFLIPILQKLPEIPYIAVGINYDWFVKDNESSLPIISRHFFYNQNSNLYKYFDQDNSVFGSYMSKDFENSRLKLNIKPIYFYEGKDKMETMHFAFNFHIELLPNLGHKTLINSLQNFKVYLDEAEKIINQL